MIDEKKLIEDITNYKFKFDCILRPKVVKQIKCLIYDLVKIINTQPKVDDWIPCSKKLPDESDYYMACIYNRDVDDFDFRKTWFAHVDDYDMEESEWRELYDFETVTAWQPLPEPYRG